VSVGKLAARGIGKVKRFGQQRNWENYRDLVVVLLQKELKVRYGNKALGYFWSVANPLASALVYYFVFSYILKIKIPDYALVLICGLFPWQWIGNSVGAAPSLFLGNASIIKKVSFPTSLIPLCTVLNHLIHFIMSFPVILLFMVIYHKHPYVSWFYGIPLLLMIQLVMTYAMSLILASINLFFRDLERLIGILLNFVFYFTPVLYSAREIPPKIANLFILNPFAYLISSWRELLIYGTLNPPHMLVSAGHALFFLLISVLVYRKLSWKFAEVI
jgi:lipopolysaccharide transport system permease protein